jgi:ATP-dependent DNA helicase RecG
VAYHGVDKRFIVDDKPFGGNLYAQFFKSMNWLHSKLNVAYDIEGQGSAPRKEIWEIPETVFKESIIQVSQVVKIQHSRHKKGKGSFRSI